MDHGTEMGSQGMLMFSLSALAVIVMIAVYTELKEKRIPNWLTLLGTAVGLLAGYLPGGITLGQSLVGLLVGFGLLFIFYVLGGMGGGDVKLMGAVGALLGWPMILPAFFFTAIVGGFMAVILLIWHGHFWEGLKRSITLFRRPKDGRSKASSDQSQPLSIPYGLAIAAGCLLTLLTGPI